MMKSKQEYAGNPKRSFLAALERENVAKLLSENINDISDDSLIKIARQLTFWSAEKLSDQEMFELTQRLVHTATWRKRSFTVPKVRYGRTGIQMPIITCGAMRFQHTWAPDFTPITISKKNVIKTPSQDHLLEVVRQCLRLGINHFETARMYGTSEVQLSHALSTLMERGEIKRSDFIFQTKMPVSSPDRKDFEKFFKQSWQNLERLGYIDLMSFWCVSKPNQADWVLSDDENGLMAAALEWKKQGKIKHIGFSTHGSADVIMRLIESNKFDYVNLHYHYFGDYHAEGTPNYQGHGNLECVKKALELDMGVFNISPIDKGGRLYNPSATVARLIGTKMSPIAFAALYSWKAAEMHTISVGFARIADLDEMFEAVEMLTKNDEIDILLKGVENRLTKHAEEKLGKEWVEKGLLNLPSFFDESVKGMGLGHVLWCYNMIHAYGMFETAYQRYSNLEKFNLWDNKKTFEDNIKAMSGGNPGRPFDESVDLANILGNHYNPALAQERIKECHNLLKKSVAKPSTEEIKNNGWDAAYDLRQWREFSDTENANVLTVVMQNVSRGWFGAGGGPTKASAEEANRFRKSIKNARSA